MSVPTLLICRCQNARMLPSTAVESVVRALKSDGIEFEMVDDLCRMAAEKDPRLMRYQSSTDVTVVACFPRAIQWLLAAAELPALSKTASVLNLRTAKPEEIIQRLDLTEASGTALKNEMEQNRTSETVLTPPPVSIHSSEWSGWYPVIDYDQCTHCLQCLNFCLFGVYSTDENKRPVVSKPQNCKPGCPACARVCPSVAILFPKSGIQTVQGEPVTEEAKAGQLKASDLRKTHSGDLHALLKSRRLRFDPNRDSNTALKERQFFLQSTLGGANPIKLTPSAPANPAPGTRPVVPPAEPPKNS